MNYLKLIILSFVLLFSACSEENKNKIHDLDNPEVVAIEFFNALYNEQNIKKAASVCSPRLSRIILHYQSPKAVARHLFNMSYDKVDIKPDDSGVKVREQFKNSAEITIYFDGYYQNDRIKDVKRLLLVQIDNKWIIEKRLKDPF
ncbi:hypothetical protein H4J58_07135 [Colwellia sp. MB3u-70]|uniref:hypothetical protein n=1 Tax=unclassified Colwellia TaxID=196834 RepID=UPI0015F49F60|nr:MULTISPECIES: hypothetical protein [unclassified Colwellia]MBA6293942.1 hypothetical protein [Colwellia sp. MB3u-8]MBA6306890.1 hypothetical protein [Colwellia sp. MB3u-70]